MRRRGGPGFRGRRARRPRGQLAAQVLVVGGGIGCGGFRLVSSGFRLLGCGPGLVSDGAQLLQRTLTSLQQSLQAVAVPVAAQLTVIDNGQEPTSLRQLLDSCGWQQAQLIANKSNSGFGSANNQAICKIGRAHV